MASIKESRLWRHVTIFWLTINMRMENARNQSSAELNGMPFSDLLLAPGEHRLPAVNGEYVQCPRSMIVHDEGNTRDAFISHVYANIRNSGPTGADQDFFSDWAIIAAHNKEVEGTNIETLRLFTGNEHVCLSVDSIIDAQGANLIPIEYLNRLDPNGWPSHRLTLKNGVPIMLLRNIDCAHGLCNGIRLIVC